MNEHDETPLSPCIKVCVVDPVSGLCIGCGRTVAEISLWSEMGPTQRRSIMAELPKRVSNMVTRSARAGRAQARRDASGR